MISHSLRKLPLLLAMLYSQTNPNTYIETTWDPGFVHPVTTYASLFNLLQQIHQIAIRIPLQITQLHRINRINTPTSIWKRLITAVQSKNMWANSPGIGKNLISPKKNDNRFGDSCPGFSQSVDHCWGHLDDGASSKRHQPLAKENLQRMYRKEHESKMNFRQ